MFSLCGYVIGAIGALVFMRREKLANVFSFGMASLSALGGLLAALGFLSAGPGAAVSKINLLPTSIPHLQYTVRLDPLGAFFLLIVSLLGLALSIYSLGYARGFYGRKNVGVLGALFNLLLLATTLVFLADNALFFFIAWEIMALTAFCLVCFEHEKVETRNAGGLFFHHVAHRHGLFDSWISFAVPGLPAVTTLTAFICWATPCRRANAMRRFCSS